VVAECRYIGGMEETKLTIRLPARLHAELVKAAEEDDRSLNREIVRLLDKGLHMRAVQQIAGLDNPKEES